MSQIIKPQPLVLGDKAHYTLSSYDPVDVVVYVPRVTNEEVELMVDQVLASVGGSRFNLNDPVWMAAHLEGVRNADELRAALRAEIQAANAEQVEQQKEQACLDALAERLNQSVLQSDVQDILEDLVASFEHDMGTSLESISAQMGTQRQAVEQMFLASAQRIAAQEAALEAYASEKRLTVGESEYATLLGVPETEVKQIVAQTRALGRGNALRDAALRAKAELTVLDECRCTYHEETEAEATERVKVLKQRLAEQGGPASGPGAGIGGGGAASAAAKGFKLV